jgi:Ferritin-like
MSNKIIELMQVPSEQQDLNWLQQSLQAAIELESSTMPPYLCGMWSIKDQSGPTYDLIQSVVFQEMLHMGLACNMLTAIGGTPRINTSVPTYPGPLPGGVRPELTVYLAGLSKEYLLNVYMQIEYPEAGPVVLALGQTFPTIGAFYDAILDAFRQLSPNIAGGNQLKSSIGGNRLFVIQTIGDVERAISEIKEQGEGTSQSPLAEDFGGELAHYYKFAEIWHGKTLIWRDGRWQYAGDPIPFPDVYQMAPIPTGGYVSPSSQVQKALQDFDQQYTTLLDNLQSAWDNHSQGDLGLAIGAMFELGSRATAIMQFQLSDGSGVYGPDFVPVS